MRRVTTEVFAKVMSEWLRRRHEGHGGSMRQFAKDTKIRYATIHAAVNDDGGVSHEMLASISQTIGPRMSGILGEIAHICLDIEAGFPVSEAGKRYLEVAAGDAKAAIPIARKEVAEMVTAASKARPPARTSRKQASPSPAQKESPVPSKSK